MSESISKRLGRLLGGKWEYRYFSWHCDDGKRTVSRCSAGVDEFDNDLGPAQYWLYGDGAPKRAERWVMREHAAPFFPIGCQSPKPEVKP